MRSLLSRRSLAAPFIALAVALSAANAVAQQKPLTVAIVDMQVILQQSEAAKSIQKQLESQRKSFQAEISKQEDSLRNAEQELRRQRTSASQQQFEQQQRQFEQRVAEVQRKTQDRKRTLDQALNDSLEILRKNVMEVVAQISQERQITLVLARQQVIMGEKSLDITDEVMQRLNQKLKSVTVGSSGQQPPSQEQEAQQPQRQGQGQGRTQKR
jgi:Skp family chaperone for outer membrane proteins